jgi:hypothetical protein
MRLISSFRPAERNEAMLIAGPLSRSSDDNENRMKHAPIVADGECSMPMSLLRNSGLR